MRVALHSSLSTGIALVAAATLVAVPVTPALSEIQPIQRPAVRLTATAGPLEHWVHVLTTTFDNVSQLGTAVAADPAPPLRQIIVNQLGDGRIAARAIDRIAAQFSVWANKSLIPTLRDTARLISTGNVVGAADALNSAIDTLLVVGFPLIEPLTIPGRLTDNLSNAVKEFTGFKVLLPIANGALGPVKATISAIGDSGQELADAGRSGKPEAAIYAIANIPAAVTDALLNGYSRNGKVTFPGLLTVGDASHPAGIVQTLLVTLPKAIAAAITPPPVKPAAESTEQRDSHAADQRHVETTDADKAADIKDGNKVAPQGATSAGPDATPSTGDEPAATGDAAEKPDTSEPSGSSDGSDADGDDSSSRNT